MTTSACTGEVDGSTPGVNCNHEEKFGPVEPEGTDTGGVGEGADAGVEDCWRGNGIEASIDINSCSAVAMGSDCVGFDEDIRPDCCGCDRLDVCNAVCDDVSGCRGCDEVGASFCG